MQARILVDEPTSSTPSLGSATYTSLESIALSQEPAEESRLEVVVTPPQEPLGSSAPESADPVLVEEEARGGKPLADVEMRQSGVACHGAAAPLTKQAQANSSSTRSTAAQRPLSLAPHLSRHRRPRKDQPSLSWPLTHTHEAEIRMSLSDVTPKPSTDEAQTAGATSETNSRRRQFAEAVRSVGAIMLAAFRKLKCFRSKRPD
jgi:hypothetical protein